jgi:3-hydroxyisobutyrate dehydrogenase-like beta-hydroxyacid dehydrogenase
VAAQTVGLLHPGEMGSAVGTCLAAGGIRVLWASEGRSDDSARRAAEARLEDARTVEVLAAEADFVLSICPPHAARDVARAVHGFSGVYVDANAISPATARQIGQQFERFVDGGIVGSPPNPTRGTRLYLSGDDAQEVADLFEGTPVDARVVSGEIGAASAVKVTYAAWSKGTAAMILAIEELAEAEGIEPVLHAEWGESQRELPERLERARRSAEAKGWRWVGEMEEIADAFAAHDLPDGFHRAAADVYRNRSRACPPAARS